MSPTIGSGENKKMLFIDQERIRRSRHHAIIPRDWRAEEFPVIIHQGIVPVTSVSSDDCVARAILPDETGVLFVPVKRRLCIADNPWPHRAAGGYYPNG